MGLLYALENVRTPLLDKLMSLVTYIGGEAIFMAAAIVVFWTMSKKCGYYMLAVGLSGVVASQFLKLVCRIPRPWVRDPDFTIVESARAAAAGYSFPSGHTTNVFASLGAPAIWVKRPALRAVLFIAVAVTAFSRMYLGVHTLADVLASAAISLVLILALYPVFRDMGGRPRRVYLVLILFILLSAACLAYAKYFPFPADTDPAQIGEGVKNSWIMLFCGAAVLLVWHADHKWLHFDTRAPFPIQIVKCVLGLGLVIVLRFVLKSPLNSAFGTGGVGDGLRYFIMVIFAGIIWPSTFRLYSGKRSRPGQ